MSPDISDELRACWQGNAEQLAAVFGGALQADVAISVGEAKQLPAEQTAEGLDGPGLVLLVCSGERSLAAMLPASCDLIPAWMASPQDADNDELDALANKLGPLLTPESWSVDRCSARPVESLSGAVQQGAPAEQARRATLELRAGESTAVLSVIWPMTQPDRMLALADERATAATEGAGGSAPSPPSPRAGGACFDRLPAYTRSLLKVRVPVRVQLAASQEGVQEIIEMAPGSILKFDKPCDDLLQLFVGDQAVAEGEAVKVGDKFGFRVTSMLMPKESFAPVRRAKRAS